MEIISSNKGRTVKTAVVKGASTHAEAAEFAMSHFGEQPHNLFDWTTDEYDSGLVTVNLYTD